MVSVTGEKVMMQAYDINDNISKKIQREELNLKENCQQSSNPAKNQGSSATSPTSKRKRHGFTKVLREKHVQLPLLSMIRNLMESLFKDGPFIILSRTILLYEAYPRLSKAMLRNTLCLTVCQSLAKVLILEVKG